jgi:hypothetical protein
MEQVTDLLDVFPELRPEGIERDAAPRTHVYVTIRARKEIEKNITAERLARFAQQAWKGLQEYVLRDEGRDSRGVIWAYGSGDTSRVCGYFLNESDRKVFVVCGVWKGKPGSGNERPDRADTVVQTAMQVRSQGVNGVKSFGNQKTHGGAAGQPQESEGAALLRAWDARRSGKPH